MLSSLFRRPAPHEATVEVLRDAIVDNVRQAALYRPPYGVADTFDGRFELLALFSALIVRRLVTLPAPGPVLAQLLTDALFDNLDDALREMGVGDVTVPKRMKKFVAAFRGRQRVFCAALDADDAAALAAALARNTYAGAMDADSRSVGSLQAYVMACARALENVAFADFAEGRFAFPSAATVPERS